MDVNLLTTIISSFCTLIGVIITVNMSASKTKAETELKLKAQEAQINEMKRDIKTHNNYAIHIPVIEAEMSHIKETLSEIKDKIGA